MTFHISSCVPKELPAKPAADSPSVSDAWSDSLWSRHLPVAGWTTATHFLPALPTSMSVASSRYRMRQLVWSPALVVMATSRRSWRHFIGFQFVSEWSLRWRCWYGRVCTTQRHVTWPTSVCRRHLRTVVASLALQYAGSSWCPGLGRLLASAALLRMAPGPGTDYHCSSITRTVVFFIQLNTHLFPH